MKNPSAESGHPYGLEFWLCYLANTLLMVSFSVLFRYADCIRFLGGNEAQLGMIVGVGMVGALAMRYVQAIGIDRYGARRVWMLSLSGFILSCIGHMWLTRVDGIEIYLLRVLMTTCIAGSFGGSLTYISLRVPAARVAEMIGMLGTSGFVGMAIGPTLGDLLFSDGEVTWQQIRLMFGVAAASAFLSLLTVSVATRHATVRNLQRQPPLWRLVRKYHPGFLMVVAAVSGLGICLPHEFLRAYTVELNLSGVSTFFLTYAATAFVIRVATRRMVERLGKGPVVLAGMLALSLSMILYLVVRQQWQLMIPAVAAGIAHALLFPAVVGSGSVSFPVRYRGLGTTLMLAMFDIGNMLGKPAIGGGIAWCHAHQLPGYSIVFSSLSVFMLVIGIAYWGRCRLSQAANATSDASSVGDPGDEVEANSNVRREASLDVQDPSATPHASNLKP